MHTALLLFYLANFARRIFSLEIQEANNTFSYELKCTIVN